MLIVSFQDFRTCSYRFLWVTLIVSAAAAEDEAAASKQARKKKRKKEMEERTHKRKHFHTSVFKMLFSKAATFSVIIKTLSSP